MLSMHISPNSRFEIQLGRATLPCPLEHAFGSPARLMGNGTNTRHSVRATGLRTTLAISANMRNDRPAVAVWADYLEHSVG